jgi:hypothetical protein
MKTYEKYENFKEVKAFKEKWKCFPWDQLDVTPNEDINKRYRRDFLIERYNLLDKIKRQKEGQVSLKIYSYVIETILPIYKKISTEDFNLFDHVEKLIKNSLDELKDVDELVDSDIVYVIAAYCNLGQNISSINHQAYSVELLEKDEFIQSYFNKDEEKLKIIKDAILQHHYSCSEINNENTSIYSRILIKAHNHIPDLVKF